MVLGIRSCMTYSYITQTSSILDDWYAIEYQPMDTNRSWVHADTNTRGALLRARLVKKSDTIYALNLDH